MLISFEGIDGAGKSTQVDILKQYLIKKGNDVVVLREPGGTGISEIIREILLSEKSKISNNTELLLFAAARCQLVEEIIKPNLEQGKIVILDRFFDSTTAYQGYGRGIPLQEVIKCNELAIQGLKPDITFFLDISIDLANQRTNKKELDRIESNGKDFFLKIIDGFHKIAQSEPNRVVVIDANGDIEHTSEQIIKQIDRIK